MRKHFLGHESEGILVKRHRTVEAPNPMTEYVPLVPLVGIVLLLCMLSGVLTCCFLLLYQPVHGH